VSNLGKRRQPTSATRGPLVATRPGNRTDTDFLRSSRAGRGLVEPTSARTRDTRSRSFLACEQAALINQVAARGPRKLAGQIGSLADLLAADLGPNPTICGCRGPNCGSAHVIGPVVRRDGCVSLSRKLHGKESS